MTKERLYELKELFYRICQFYHGAGRDTIVGAGVDKGETTEYVLALAEAEKTCFGGEKELAADADEVLLYALLRIKMALKERDYRLAGDLSFTATRLCGVYDFPYLARRRFWTKEVLPLRDKHGDELFSEIERVFFAEGNTPFRLSPSFSTRLYGARYYDEDSDAQMKEAHPVLYTVFAVIGMLLFLGTILSYGVLLGKGRALDILGYVGASLVGTGLFSVTMAFIRQYMGHKLTAVLFAVGAVFVLLASVL